MSQIVIALYLTNHLTFSDNTYFTLWVVTKLFSLCCNLVVWIRLCTLADIGNLHVAVNLSIKLNFFLLILPKHLKKGGGSVCIKCIFFFIRLQLMKKIIKIEMKNPYLSKLRAVCVYVQTHRVLNFAKRQNAC